MCFQIRKYPFFIDILHAGVVYLIINEKGVDYGRVERI